MKKKPANEIQDLQYFGEFGGVNPSISDSSTYEIIKRCMKEVNLI